MGGRLTNFFVAQINQFGTSTGLDVTTSQHGLVPIADGNAAHFLNGLGSWAATAAGTFVLIEDKDLSAATAQTTFNTGLSGYRYFVLKWNVTCASGSGRGLNLFFNNNTAANQYWYKKINGTTVANTQGATSIVLSSAGISTTASCGGTAIIPATAPTATANSRAIDLQSSETGGETCIEALYMAAAAQADITRIDLLLSADSLRGHASLYGIV